MNINTSSGDEDPVWPHLRDDEDFIIFRFKEDGDFDVVKKSVDEIPACSSASLLRSKPINRKLNYEESAKKVVIERSFNNAESEEREESVRFEADHICGGKFEEHRRVKSGESTQSSNASSGSFAFPVLGWERIGSPEKMPKSEALRFRKHRPRFVAFQCCRF